MCVLTRIDCHPYGDRAGTLSRSREQRLCAATLSQTPSRSHSSTRRPCPGRCASPSCGTHCLKAQNAQHKKLLQRFARLTCNVNLSPLATPQSLSMSSAAASAAWNVSASSGRALPLAQSVALVIDLLDNGGLTEATGGLGYALYKNPGAQLSARTESAKLNSHQSPLEPSEDVSHCRHNNNHTCRAG